MPYRLWQQTGISSPWHIRARSHCIKKRPLRKLLPRRRLRRAKMLQNAISSFNLMITIRKIMSLKQKQTMQALPRTLRNFSMALAMKTSLVLAHKLNAQKQNLLKRRKISKDYRHLSPKNSLVSLIWILRAQNAIPQRLNLNKPNKVY